MARDVTSETCAPVAIAKSQPFDVGLGAATHRPMDSIKIPVVAMQMVGKQGSVAHYKFATGFTPVSVECIHDKASRLGLPPHLHISPDFDFVRQFVNQRRRTLACLDSKSLKLAQPADVRLWP
jgi:hypothetical protein